MELGNFNCFTQVGRSTMAWLRSTVAGIKGSKAWEGGKKIMRSESTSFHLNVKHHWVKRYRYYDFHSLFKNPGAGKTCKARDPRRKGIISSAKNVGKFLYKEMNIVIFTFLVERQARGQGISFWVLSHIAKWSVDYLCEGDLCGNKNSSRTILYTHWN